LFLGKAKINSFEKGVSREWILADGKGNFSATTLIDVPTRELHAIFSVINEPMLVKLEEKVSIGKKECFLSTNRYSSMVYPDGYRYITSVSFNPFPTYIFSVNESLIKKRVLIESGKLFINYYVISTSEPVNFEVSPLLPSDSNSIPYQHGIELGTIVNVKDNKLMIRVTSGEYNPRPRFYENIEYLGSGSKKVFWSPGAFSFSLKEGESVTLEVSAYTNIVDMDFNRLWGMKERFYKTITNSMPCKEDFLYLLMAVGDTLLIERGELRGIISGYFSLKERGRETFISLPGLLIATRRIDDAKLCLFRWLEYFSDRGLPYEIDGQNPIYQGEESTLWFAYALTKFLAYTNDLNLAEEFFPKLRTYVNYLLESKKVDKDGLIVEDDPANNWMGIRLKDEFIVERKGKLVDLNALWYNMISLLSRLSDALNVRHSYDKLLSGIRESFLRTFWLEEEGYFKDTDEGKELRPNQVLAMSLPFTPVPKDIGRIAINNIWKHLYTTYGLRTLSPFEKKYKGREEGDETQKLKARWRGMAWPWLLGHFFSAFRRYLPEKGHILELMWMPFLAHMEEGCIGGIAEVFDGSMPYEPHGDILYAPSQGEIIRSFIEDVKGIRPNYEKAWSDSPF